MKRMSLKVKIITIISIIAVLGIIMLLLIILTTNNNKTKPTNNNQSEKSSDLINEESNDQDNLLENISDYNQLEFFFITLAGYWTSDNMFFAFINKDNNHFVEYGLYRTSYGEYGEIKDAKVTGTNTFKLTILIPLKPKDEMSDEKPERTEEIYVDISNYKKENRLNIKIDNNICNKQWCTYEYGGISLEKAFKDSMEPEY